jgi:protease-4
MFDTGRASGDYIEKTIVSGPADNKIAIVNLYGIIDAKLCYEVTTQLKQAATDDGVKAVIVRTVSPGGTVSASDRIHHQISLLRQETGKPVVAFMQTVAASGGYYTSVACNKIIAEPTTITGSIGVIMNHLTIKELLEEKLGIIPVTVKSGEKKDWPSMFTETTEEQKEYLYDKLITPAYNRFVNLVTKGRRDVLTPFEVKELANGSIFSADEALAKKLIDEIGYIDEAVELAQSLAKVKNARVIEYKKPQSLLSALTAQSENSWIPDRNTLQELAVPKLLYLWNANW